MTTYFIYPTIVSLPLGYDATVAVGAEQIMARLAVSTASVECAVRVMHEGRQIREERRLLRFEGGRLASERPGPFVSPDLADQGAEHPGYLEMSIKAVDEAAIFASKTPIPLYTVYGKPGKKSFFSDNAYKYGAPPVIKQMADIGQYVDGHPLIHLDCDRDLGETIVLINPYKKQVIATIRTPDGRTLPRLRIPPMSARNIRLEALLAEGERAWIGQIQLSANNRLITFIIKHSLADPLVISDHEHLDPYRTDPTHFPVTQVMRVEGGRLASRTVRLLASLRGRAGA